MADSRRRSAPPPVSDDRELANLLALVGSVKLALPWSIRGLLNSTGLYVQVQTLPRYDGDIKKVEWVLKAGGKFRSCFEARHFGGVEDWMISSDDGSVNSIFVSMIQPDEWNVYRLNHDVWQRRFAGLVWPTYEIAAHLSWLKDDGRLGDSIEISRIHASAEHLKRSGEWLGVADIQCSSCSTDLWIWEYEPYVECPSCGVSPESKNPVLGLASEEGR